MEFEWDDAKNRGNLVKHGFSFEDAEQVFAGPCLTFETPASTTVKTVTRHWGCFPGGLSSLPMRSAEKRRGSSP
jgi:uncharacterized DUF497 family protein